MIRHQTPEQQPDATRPIQIKNHLEAPRLYGEDTPFAFEQLYTPNSGRAYGLGRSNTLYMQQPLGSISLNTSAHVGYEPQATSNPSYPSTSATTFSSVPALGVFSPELPFALDQAAFGGMVHHPAYHSKTTTEPPAARFNSMVMPSTSGAHGAQTSLAGPSDQQRGPAKSKTKRRQLRSKKPANSNKHGAVGSRRNYAVKPPSSQQALSSSSDRDDIRSYKLPQIGVVCRQVGTNTILLPSAPPMSDEEFAAFQAESLSSDYAKSLAYLFEAPLEGNAAAQVSQDDQGVFTVAAPSPVSNCGVHQIAPVVVSADQVACSGSSKHSLLTSPLAQRVQLETDGELALDPTLGEADDSPADGLDSHSYNNIVTDATSSHKPHTKHERPRALEHIRRSYPVREAIKTDIATFKAACQTSKSAAIAALPVYFDLFRPEVESQLAQQPAAPAALTRRQRVDKAQPCLLCGVPIHGRGYAMTADHRTRCKVMMALVEEDCVADFLDAKNVDMSWRALRQLIPGFTLPKKQGMMPTAMDRQGGRWQVLKGAMATEAAKMIAKGAVVVGKHPVPISTTEVKASSSGVAGTSGKRKRDDLEESDGAPVGSPLKRAYVGPSSLGVEGSSRAGTEGETDGQ